VSQTTTHMAWPCLKWSKDPWQARPQSGTLRGSIYLRKSPGEFSYINFKNLSPDRKLQVLETLDGYKELSSDVQFKFAHSSDAHLKRVIELWRTIEDCIVLSSPEKVGKPISKFIWRFWKWCMSNAIHSVDSTTGYWKQFCKYLQWRNADCHLNDNPGLDPGFPGSSRTELRKCWFKEFPWLQYAFTTDDKYLQEKLSHLCNYRGAPPPSLNNKVLDESFDLLRGRLTRRWPIKQDLALLIIDSASTLAKYTNAREEPSAAHVSMSAMASYDGPRSIGGRATEFCKSFIRDYVQSVASEDLEGTTWFGTRYWTKTARPKFETMCREFPLKEVNYEFLVSNFESRFSLPFEPDYTIEEPIIGVDSQLGYQMLQHSLETGMAKGYILGPKWKIPGANIRLSIGKPPPVRFEAVGESGAKLRWISISEAWLNVILQPLGHELSSLLCKDPVLRSGFARTWKGYDFATDLHRQSELTELGPYYAVQGDLEVATDNMTHRYVCIALKAYLHAAGRGTQFLYLLVDLLTSPRDVYRRGIYQFTTSSGILMGDPGTKSALALMTRLARHIAYLRYKDEFRPTRLLNRQMIVKPAWLVGRCAGDDFIEIGPLQYLRWLYRAHIMLGHKIGTYMYTQRACRYCEETLFFKNKNLGQNIDIWKIPYNETIHVDALKVRVFSPCGKVCPGPNEDLKNPIIGKGQALTRKLPWLTPNWSFLADSLKLRWISRMEDYMDLNDPYWFIPNRFGGTELPNPYSWDEIVYRILQVCPEYFMFTGLVIDGSAPYWLTKALQAMASGGISRGSELNLKQSAHEGYVLSAEISGHRKTQDEIAILLEIEPKEFNNYSRAQRRNLAKRVGYITEYDLDNRIDKAWMIKSSFQRAFYGVGNYPIITKGRLPPYFMWEQLREISMSEMAAKLPQVNFQTEALKFCDFLNSYKRPRETQHFYIEEVVLSRNFGALRTPLPGHIKDIACVRGSTADII
jgi:hypothetical protein